MSRTPPNASKRLRGVRSSLPDEPQVSLRLVEWLEAQYPGSPLQPHETEAEGRQRYGAWQLVQRLRLIAERQAEPKR